MYVNADYARVLPFAGTTIVGCIYAGDPNDPNDKGGVVLGADTRATEGPIVADKNCEKVRTQLSYVILPVVADAMLVLSLQPHPGSLTTPTYATYHSTYAKPLI